MRIGSTAQAIAAYNAAARRPEPPQVAQGAAPSFGSVLRQELAGTVAELRRGEAASVAGVTGRSSIQEVVEAVSQAELGLQKLAAVRDRAISAYQEILRMPI
ncbi:flagellar hook-basal body complex protein FliE [Geminicoccaceae bacterium 1502E]|nr:flagellar hook-basal body complex protein FliE [Geminicoccaceae bacterium 1502E]